MIHSHLDTLCQRMGALCGNGQASSAAGVETVKSTPKIQTAPVTESKQANDGAPSIVKNRRRYTKRQDELNKIEQIDGECSVLVSDLTGLTKSTRKYGVIHVTSVLTRMNQIMRPLFKSLDSIMICDEADDMIVAFKSSKNAMLAACLLPQVFKYYNDTLKSNNKDNKDIESYFLNLSGVGLATSSDIVLDKSINQFYGRARLNAYSLGENFAFENTVCCTESFKKSFDSDNNNANSNDLLSFNNIDDIKNNPDNHMSTEFTDEQKEMLKLVNENVYEINGDFLKYLSNNKMWPPVIASPNDLSCFKNKNIGDFTQRYNYINDKNKLAEMDELMDKKYLRKNQVAVMFDMHLVDISNNEINKNMTALKQLLIKDREILDILAPIYDNFEDIIEFGETFLLFEIAINALLCCLKVADAIKRYNNNNNNGNKMRIESSGFGIDCGNVLFVENSFICFGDCINSASKLGQDLAKPLEIWISDRCYQMMKSDTQVNDQLSNVNFTKHTKNVEGRETVSYLVTQM